MKPASKPKAYVWVIFFLSASFLFYKYILQVSPSVMTSGLMQTYSLSGTALGFLVGFYFYTYMIMQIPSGILLDRYGPRKVTSMAILLCALGTLIFAKTDSFAVACFGRLLVGFGAAFATTSYMKLAGTRFPPQYFPLLSGLFGTACMAGAGTAQAPLAWLMETEGLSWRHTLVLCGIIGLVLAALFWLIVKDLKEEVVSDQRYHHFNFADFVSILKNKSNWPLMLYGGLAFTPVAVFGGLWGVPYLMQAYPIAKTVAASAVSLAFFGFALGGIVIGWIGKRVQSHLRVMTIGTALSLMFLMVVLYVPHLSLWQLNTCIFLFGACASGFLMSYTIARSINSSLIIATAIGVINMGDPLCGAIAEPLIGKILDLHWDGTKIDNVRIFSVHAYQLGLSVLTVYMILALVCCYFIKEKKLS